MKDNREFLEGVYHKAELLQKEKTRKTKSYKNLVKYSSVAAIFIILPLLLFNNQMLNPNTDFEEPIQPRIMNVIDPVSNFYEADYILIGITKDVDLENATISIEQVLYGDLSEDEILVNTSNGIEVNIFTIEERQLFFLNKNGKYYLTLGVDSIFKEITNNIFIDSYGNEYDLENIKSNIDRR